MLSVVGLMVTLWKNDKSVTTWYLPRPCATFREKYDSIQDQLKALSCMDDLLSGKLLSTSDISFTCGTVILYHSNLTAIISNISFRRR